MKTYTICLLLLALAACSGSSVLPAVPTPEFQLLDVNLTSDTYNQPVSPRDYLTRVTGWYFGAAT